MTVWNVYSVHVHVHAVDQPEVRKLSRCVYVCAYVCTHK